MNMKQSQSGVALIVVLLFLILITIVGVITVRQARTDLKVATADQANALMLNTSDSVLAHIEQIAANPTGGGNQLANTYAQMMSESQGIFGYFLVNTDQKVGEQLAFCYQPSNEKLFNIANTRTLLYGGGTRGSNGICDASKKSDYATDRQIVMNQVVVRNIEGDSPKNDNFATQVTGEQVGAKGKIAIQPNLHIHSVSVLPSLTSASSSDISDCLAKPAGSGANDYGQSQNMTACLKEQGIPATALVEETVLREENQGGYRNNQVVGSNTACAGDSECIAASS